MYTAKLFDLSSVTVNSHYYYIEVKTLSEYYLRHRDPMRIHYYYDVRSRLQPCSYLFLFFSNTISIIFVEQTGSYEFMMDT